VLKKGQPAGRVEPVLSIVLPALNEEAALPGVLASLARQEGAPPFEVILADGGSADRTVASFGRWARERPVDGLSAREVVRARPGRAVQMNAGAAAARGEVLLFLHADTELPAGALRAVAAAMADGAVIGGGFALRYTESKVLLRLIAWYATLRSHVRGIHYGDQAPFVRRAVFEAFGGFPEVALFEDLLLARAMRAAGPVTTLPLAVRTSARRLLEGGVARSALRFTWIKARYALGVDPSQLRGDYPDVR
jgi:rSAM/selenodomain-associated transferase 2